MRKEGARHDGEIPSEKPWSSCFGIISAVKTIRIWALNIRNSESGQVLEFVLTQRLPALANWRMKVLLEGPGWLLSYSSILHPLKPNTLLNVSFRKPSWPLTDWPLGREFIHASVQKNTNKTCQCAPAAFPSPTTAWELLRVMTAAHSSPRPLCPAHGHGERAQRGVFRQQDRRAVNWKTLLLPVSTPRRDFRDVSNESLQHIWDCPLPS